MVEVFDEHDAPYFQWMNANPKGFVANILRPSESRFACLHISNCRSIAPNKRSGQDIYTGQRNIKICSNSIDELLDWIAKNRPEARGFSDVCRVCCPPYRQ